MVRSFSLKQGDKALFFPFCFNHLKPNQTRFLRFCLEQNEGGFKLSGCNFEMFIFFYRFISSCLPGVDHYIFDLNMEINFPALYRSVELEIKN